MSCLNIIIHIIICEILQIFSLNSPICNYQLFVRHDSRSNGLEENSQDEQISSKRFRTSDDIETTGSLGTPPDRSVGSGEGVGSNGDGDGIIKTKKTKGRVKISMEYIPNKLRRYTTFSKRKSGIMKKVRNSSIELYLIYKLIFNFWNLQIK